MPVPFLVRACYDVLRCATAGPCSACRLCKEKRAEVRGLVLAMVRRDDELRLSVAWQAEYARERESIAWKVMVTERIQRQVAEEFGFVPVGDSALAISLRGRCIEFGVQVLRSSSFLFPQDEEIINAAHYLRQNIMQPCPFQVGQPVPDVFPLSPASGPPVSLLEVLTDLPTDTALLLAGSHT
mmetsp:Transcript_32772/g.91791  ORF Transcript_32772/g.91791 Transcript_32772/m.91791 type:complete len:183 (+) Transcript_32772:427-975(+)